MKSKVLITITIWFILNVLLVDSQEAKCPPDCSSPSKITETSYLDSNSYNDKKFYENSDPKKWNFRDSNFDYSKIPLAKYKELPYTNPDVDHSRLDPNKYISAFGCSTCTFRIATTQKIQYSTDGVFHTKTGLARIPGNYPPNTLFVATNEGIFIGLPKIDEKSKLDISNVGSATLITNDQKVTLSNGLTINGRLSFKENQAFVSKNDELILEGIKIKPKGNDVFVYFDGQQHQGNYIAYGQKNLIAQGNNFDLEFTSENKLVKVFSANEWNRRLQLIKGWSESPELFQSDHLTISVGDRMSKSGRIELTNRDDQNLMPLMETKGFVKMLNDRNDITIDGNQFNMGTFYSSYGKIFRGYSVLLGYYNGAVPMQVKTEDNEKNIYVFDETTSVIVISKEESERLDQLRRDILKEHNILLNGYFKEKHLQEFSESLKNMEKKIGIDFSKYEEVKGKKIEILQDSVFAPDDPYKYTASANPADARIVWDGYSREKKLGKYDTIPKDRVGKDVISHEMGHILIDDYNKLTQRFKEKGLEFSMSLQDVSHPAVHVIKLHQGITRNNGPNELFPSDYSKANVNEYIAETFNMMIERPRWFTDPYEAGKEEIWFRQYNKPVSEDVLKKRQAFRDIWLEELKKYQK